VSVVIPSTEKRLPEKSLALNVLPSNVAVENPPTDFTPYNYITLIFTDLGVLTPSAVSDELIRLYQ
jgi:translation initiation factor 2B subunit (eIF-2B alpha/beta/delta family)